MRSVVRLVLLALLVLCLQLDLSIYDFAALPWCGMSFLAQNPQLQNPLVAENWLGLTAFACYQVAVAVLWWRLR